MRTAAEGMAAAAAVGSDVDTVALQSQVERVFGRKLVEEAYLASEEVEACSRDME